MFFFGLPLTLFLANSAAWDFYEQHKAEIKWDLTVINPPYVSRFFLFVIIITKIKNTSSLTATTNGQITGIRGE